MKDALLGLKKRGRLLLHACCAVCAGGVLGREFKFGDGTRRLSDFFDITLYFYNPNIDIEDEYFKRAGELSKLKSAFDISDIVIESYKPAEFLATLRGFERCSETGLRCDNCIGLRLNRAAQYAKENDVDVFCTTLSVSPHKDAIAIDRLGKQASEKCGVAFLPADFKKEDGFFVAGEVAKRLDIYRQNYCGCAYSKR